ncbi:hypothetical protein ACWDAO_14825 [Streptomyces sp. NPDC001212]
MLDPKNLHSLDEATALGLTALWNDAVPAILHMLDHQVHDIREGIRQALECDREDCETHGVRHRDGDAECPCWGCENAGLLTMAKDTRHWLTRAHDGTGDQWEYDPDALLGQVTTWLYVNRQAPKSAPTYHLGAVYRLAAELADQAAAQHRAHLMSLPNDPWGPQ